MSFQPLTTSVTSESRAGAEMALAWFQMGQTEPITVEIGDDLIKVFLDNEYLSYPFDSTEGMDRDVWAVHYNSLTAEPAYSYLAGATDLDEDARLAVSDVIDEMFAELGSFAYGAAAAAIDTLGKGN